MISIIVATSKNGVIGDSNKLIWHLPEDLKRFKSLTTGHPIIMGRKTYESIGRPLPNRRNIVITRNSDWSVDGCEIVNSLEEAILITGGDCFIIGGGEIYKKSIDIADRIYLTLIDKEFEGDTTFPKIDDRWFVSEREEMSNGEYNWEFIQYDRFNF